MVEEGEGGYILPYLSDIPEILKEEHKEMVFKLIDAGYGFSIGPQIHKLTSISEHDHKEIFLKLFILQTRDLQYSFKHFTGIPEKTYDEFMQKYQHLIPKE